MVDRGPWTVDRDRRRDYRRSRDSDREIGLVNAYDVVFSDWLVFERS